jgi:hypothetical protein
MLLNITELQTFPTIYTAAFFQPLGVKEGK